MRKKSSRSPRLVAKLLSPMQHCRLVIGPRIHLDLLLAGSFDFAYVCSVAGLLNVAGSAAYHKGHREVQAEIHKGQYVVLRLIENARGPDETEALVIRDALNVADRWLVAQDTLILAKAIKSCERESAYLKQVLSPRLSNS